MKERFLSQEITGLSLDEITDLSRLDNSLDVADMRREELLSFIGSVRGSLCYVQKSMRDYEMCVQAVRAWGSAIIKEIPKKHLTYELCMIAVKRDPYSLGYVPKEFQTDAFYSEALNDHIDRKSGNTERILERIPECIFTKEVCLKMVGSNGSYLRYVPKKMRAKNVCLAAIKQNGAALAHCPKRFITEAICTAAVNSYARALEFVPVEMRTVTLCIEAIKLDRRAARYVPDSLKSNKLILAAEKIAGYHRFVNMRYDSIVQKFIAEPEFCLPEKKSQYEFKSFKAFFQFVGGDLFDADLYDYDFKGIDLTKFNVTGAKISSDILSTFGLYDDTFYKNHILTIRPPLIPPTDPEEFINPVMLIRAEDKLHLSFDRDTQTFFYITDLHLDHRIAKEFKKRATRDDVTRFIRGIVDKLDLDRISENKDVSMYNLELNAYLLIGGDVASDFELAQIFYRELAERWYSKHIIVILGNHDLWDIGIAPGLNCISDVVAQYEALFEELEIIFLQNSLLTLDFDPHGTEQFHIFNEDAILSADSQWFSRRFSNSRMLILGGLGFSGYNPIYNATVGLYSNAILTREEDVEMTSRFEAIYNRLHKFLGDKPLIVLSHTQKDNWSNLPYNPEWVYVNGHTHRNYFVDNDEMTVYADNQLGYSGSIGMKFFSMSRMNDIFRGLADGIYRISRMQYMMYQRGMGVLMDFHRPDLLSLYMLINGGIKCFIAEAYAPGKLYMLDGGTYNKLTHDDIRYYYDRLPIYVDMIKRGTDRYNGALNSISTAIKSLGGTGNIHGCIVDIDFFHHVYLNPFDGTVKAYSADSMVEKYVYPNIEKLLQDQLPALYDKLQKLVAAGSTQTGELCKINSMPSTVPEFVTDTSMYHVSRVMKKFQYATTINVVRHWDDSLMQKYLSDGVLPLSE